MAQSHFGYSAPVSLSLRIGQQTIDVAQVTTDMCILRNTSACEPGPAELIMRVNGQEQRWQVYLPDGIIAGQRETRFESKGSTAVL